MCCLMVFWLNFLLLFSIRINYLTIARATTPIEEENVSLYETEAVEGNVGWLPCNVTPNHPGDKITLVIWDKDGYTKPIYSFDSRRTDLMSGSHYANVEVLGDRGFFQVNLVPPTLTIHPLERNDSGTYRCRVDFLKSPTRKSKIQLNIIVPPEKLLIPDVNEQRIREYVTGNVLGPYNEGYNVNITCISIGGTPLPNVTWWYNDELLDDTYENLSNLRVKNVLQLKKLTRDYLHKVITCKASNNNVTEPISNSVALDMYLPPLWVKLQGENSSLSADNSYELRCEVVGARPAPKITWWKGSVKMENTRTIVAENISTSLMTFTPTVNDQGKYLSCRAEQERIYPGTEKGWTLDIYHTPIVTLEFGTNLNTSVIREGADVYFECNIKSNPWINYVSWRHNGKTLDNNVPEGIIVANQSLVLQNVSRIRSGLYTCIGSNNEGDGESNPVQLDIRFAPLCRVGQKTVYSTGRLETVKIVCELEASPLDIKFFWKFNISATEFVDIQASHIFTDRGKSTANYTPVTELDYGTLLCWGSNDIGVQIDPCVYTIMAAGKPDPPTNCTVLNQTFNGFEIECKEGFDGGLPQEFVTEIYIVGNRQHPVIMKSKQPYFELRSLNSGTEYNIFVIAQNKRGRSNSTYLTSYTLKSPEKQTAMSGPAVENLKPFLALLFGIVASMMLIAIIIVFIVHIRGSSGRDRNNCENYVTTTTAGTIHNTQTVTTSIVTTPASIQSGGVTNQRNVQSIQEATTFNESTDSIERNPDIIPSKGPNKMADKDEDEKDFEWINNSIHPRIYATAALAEQNSINNTKVSGGYKPFTSFNEQNCLRQSNFPVSQQHQSLFTSNYSTMIPRSKHNYIHKEISYSELPPVIPSSQQQLQQQQQRIQFSSATLGRPKITQLKQQQQHEPTIYSQIDLARPHPIYIGSSSCDTAHPSPQLTTFPPPPLFANSPTNNLTYATINRAVCFADKTNALQTVPESSNITTNAGNSISVDDKTIINGTRF